MILVMYNMYNWQCAGNKCYRKVFSEVFISCHSWQYKIEQFPRFCQVVVKKKNLSSPGIFVITFLRFVICHKLQWLITSSHNKGILFHNNHKTFLHSYITLTERFVTDHKEKLSHTIFWLIKETFSLWSIKNISVIDNRTFWHCR